MKTTVEKLPKSEIKLTVELDEERTRKLYDKAAAQVSEMVKVPGFRPGHVPLEVLKKHVKPDALEAHMLDIALPETYAEAVKKENLQVVTQPKVKILSGEPLKYEAVVAVYPEVEISGYDKIKIPSEDAKVEDKDVDEVLEDVRKRRAAYKDVDRAAKNGDKLEIDFEGFDDGGAPLENTKSLNHPVVLGEGSLVPGFEEELTGLKKDDNKEFTVTFPKDYFHQPFRGKKVTFKVKVNRVQEIELPEFTDEFLKELTGTDKPLEEVKKDIKHNLLHEKEHAVKVKREDAYLDKIADLVKVEIPDSLLEEEIDSMVEEFKSQLEGRGIDLKQYLEQTKKELKDLSEMRRKEAEKRLRLRFALHQIFEQEKITASKEEIDHEIKHILELYPEAERENVLAEYKEGSYLIKRLENKIKMDKLFAAYLGK